MENDYIVFCDDITGILGEIFAADTSLLPDEAVWHLQEAYKICAEQL